MTREPEKPIREVAEEYLSVLENGTNQEQLDVAEREVEGLRDRHERFIDKYGESDPATEELNDRLRDAEQRAEELEAKHRFPKTWKTNSSSEPRRSCSMMSGYNHPFSKL